jgi:hypothetical protein
MKKPLVPIALAVLLAAPALARGSPPTGPGPGGPPRPEGKVVGSGVSAAERKAIAWYGTWEGAQAEARRSGKPILLLSAAPHCHNVSGVW